MVILTVFMTSESLTSVTVREALAKIGSIICDPANEIVEVDSAVGRIAAEDMLSPESIPVW